MTRLVVLLLVLALPAPAMAGPLQASLQKEAARLAHDPPGHWEERPITSPTFVWIGIGTLALGTFAVLAALTFKQQSDLSQEHPSTRLGRDLAPCNTDPEKTAKPIADCKTHHPLLAAGISLQGAGAAMIIYGARPLPAPSPALTVRVRF